KNGVQWIHAPIALAHPFPDGTAATMYQSLDTTERALGEDGPAWRRLFEPVAANWDRLAPDLLGPLLRVPRRPFGMLRFGLQALPSAHHLARHKFKNPHTRALFAGLAAHALLPLDDTLTASFGILLGATAHAVGWPLARGGSVRIAETLVRLLGESGGEV